MCGERGKDKIKGARKGRGKREKDEEEKGTRKLDRGKEKRERKWEKDKR